ncbi:MAG: glutathione S-transferase family protein [Paraperlucidibaca sp.]
MYQLFGMEVSPYSVKVRAFLRFKGLPHEWLLRTKANEPAFIEKAKLPLIPLLITPAGDGIQDSTPIMNFLEHEHSSPSAQLTDPALNFLAYAIEEAADEWLIKAMFHYRWNYEADRIDASMRLAKASVAPGKDPTSYAEKIALFLMARREPLGCTSGNAEAIEAQLDETALRLDQHLGEHRFVFGETISYADFGLASMFYELLSDPTPRQRLAKLAHIRRWVDSVMAGADSYIGHATSWAALAPTLTPLLEHLLLHTYLPWARANAAHVAAGELFTVHIQGHELVQPAQKYPAKSWQTLQQHWQALSDAERVSANNYLNGLDAAMT